MSILDPISKRLLTNAGQRGPISLMYHSLSAGKSSPKWEWEVSFQAFTEQLNLLHDLGWNTFTADQLQLGISQLPPRSVLITFDDGYANNFMALNALNNLNMRASWFVVTNHLGNISSWADQDTLKQKLLSETQLLEMHSAGMEIGSHSCTHCFMDSINDDQLNYELIHSKNYLTDLLNKPSNTLAYPYGKYNQKVIEAAKATGYQVAFTTRTGSGLIENDLLQVRRIAIMANDSLSTFARKLAFADNDVSWKKIKRYGLARIKARVGL